MIKKFVFFLFVFIFFLFNNSFAAQKVTLQLRWDHQFQFAGYYAAKWQGYYDAVDLDVDIKSAVTPDGILSAVKEVSQGRAQFGIGSADILKAIDDGDDLVLVASIFQHSAAGFYSRKDTIIHSPADFLKLKVARRVNDLIDIEFQAMLRAEGINPDEIKPYPHQPGMDHLISGAVDVAPGYLINIPFTAFTKGLSINEFRPIKYGIDFYGDSIFTHQNIVQTDPDLIKRFKSASLKGWEYALDNKEELIKKISTELIRAKNIDDPEGFNLFQSQNIYKLIHHPEVEIGHINPARWERMGQYLNSIGILKNDLDFNRVIFDPEKLEKIKSQKVQKNLTILIASVSIILLIAILWLRTMRLTVKKKTEELFLANESLKKSEKKYRDLFNLAQEGIWVIDKDNNTDFVNPSMARMLGYSPQEMKDKSLFDFMDEAGIETANKNIERRKEGISEQHDFEFIRKDGQRIYTTMETSSILDGSGNYNGAIAGVIDITDRKRAETDLLQQKQFLQKAQEIGKIGTWELDIKNNKLLWTEENYKIFGIPIGTELTYELFLDCVHPDDREYVDTEWKAAFSGKPYDIVHRLIADGKTKWVREKAELGFNEKGDCIKGTGLTQDITEQKKSEIEKIKEKQKAERYLNLAGVMFIGLDKDGNINLANEKASQILEVQQKEVLGQNWFENFIPQDIRDEVHSVFEQIISGVLEHFEYHENLIISKTGIEKHIAWHNKAIKNDNGEIIGLLSSGEDITEKKLLQSKLVQAQKMESIGTLAGGIAHDFNNILSSIIGFTELALNEVEKGTDLEDDLQEVKTAGNRAKGLVKQILAFARQSDETVKPIQVSVIAEEVLKFIKSSIPSTIQIDENINSDSFIMGSPTQVHQILMNLCTNSSHAMEIEGGILGISLEDVTIAKDSTILDLRHGEYIKIDVTDTGMGISPKDINNIFEPYYTTKPVGEGTGMGLAVVHGIVESYGGRITVDSTLNKGTRFSVYLSISKKRKKQPSIEKTPLPSGNERILLVDDETSIAKMGSKVLERLGYSVTARTNSVEALQLFRSKPEEFDIVITDMTMPNMTGDKLAVELIKIRPDIPVILCTGYSKNITEESAAEIDIKALVYKPIAKAELAKTVRKVLDEANCSE